MKINWIRKHVNWAFGHMCNHFSKKMPTHDHVFDSKDGDINYVCSPNFFKGIKGNSRTIAHVDSNRWYEVFLKDNE